MPDEPTSSSSQKSQENLNPQTPTINEPLSLSPDFNLQFLCSLFITICNNTIKLAHSFQQPALLVFIISKLTGTVRTQLQGKLYANYDELKQILFSQYQDKEHYVQLMEELNSLRQGMN